MNFTPVESFKDGSDRSEFGGFGHAVNKIVK